MGLIRRTGTTVRKAFGVGATRMRHRPAMQFKNGEFSLTALQVAQLIAAAQAPRDALIIRVFAETGMRRSELINLCWDDLDTERRLLVIRHGKGGKLRLIPITRRLVMSLLQLQSSPHRSGFIFVSRQAQRLSARQVNRIVAHTGQCAGIQHPNPRYAAITPHLFRHTFARLWKARGGSMESLSKVLGHHDLLTTASVYGTESLLDVQRNYDHTIAGMFRTHSRRIGK